MMPEPKCESLECEHCFREEAMSIIREALAEHEATWGPVESHQGDEDWSTRAAALLGRSERRQ